jgi:hypothetical protein
MNRAWCYIGFAVWFAGLGYIALWLFVLPGHSMLPLALHVIGLSAAAFIPFRLLLYAVRRRHPAPGAGAVSLVPARKPSVIWRALRRRPARPLRPVKPRSHFGLRGMPH